MNNAEQEYMNKGPPIIELATRLTSLHPYSLFYHMVLSNFTLTRLSKSALVFYCG